MRGLQVLSGYVRIRYRSADTGTVLSEIEKRLVTVYDVHSADSLTMEFTTHRKNLDSIGQLAARRGEEMTVTGRMGLFWSVQYLLKRPLLLTGMLLIITVSILLPSRILFVSVEGNHRIPSRLILEEASKAGLDFWSVRREIRSEKIKNQLLQAIPELKWAGVNTYGTHAIITVRERDDNMDSTDQFPVKHIVAGRDGVIVSCTVTDGCGLCCVGQAVKAGDILISGYTDCGITICAGVAKGKILAQTNRDFTAVTPVNSQIRTQHGNELVRYGLILGKKRINFYKGSGISGATCVKMSLEYVLQLPGGFELPVCLVKEHIVNYETAYLAVDSPEQELKSFASDYLSGRMVSGTVICATEQVTQLDNRWVLDGHYACIEDIGLEQEEKIGDFHGETNGTDRERGSG